MAKKKELEAKRKAAAVAVDDPIKRLENDLKNEDRKKKKVIKKKKKVVKDDQDDLVNQNQIDQDDQDPVDQDLADQDQMDQDQDDDSRQPADYCDDCGGCDGCDGCEGCDGYSSVPDDYYYGDSYSVEPDDTVGADADPDDDPDDDDDDSVPIPPKKSGSKKAGFIPSMDTLKRNGPGKAYKYWDYDNRIWVITQNFWVAKQASDLWDVVWLWYENGRIKRPLTKDEMIRYLP